MTALMRWRTFRAVWTSTCQIGVRTSSASALVTSQTGRLPLRGEAWSCKGCSARSERELTGLRKRSAEK